MFKLPIEYIDRKTKIDKDLLNDLELNTLYKQLFHVEYKWCKNTERKWSEYYTDDVTFLKETQKLFKNWNDKLGNKPKLIDDMYSILNEYTIEDEKQVEEKGLEEKGLFHSKYQYINHKTFRYLNNSSVILQLVSMYNLCSPVLSLIIPLIMLIVPFFILKFKGANISITNYVELVKVMFKNHSISKLFTQFGDGGWDKRFFLIMSVVFYIFQIYNNVISCYTFYTNIYKIQLYMKTTIKYIEYTKDKIDAFVDIYKSCKLKKYKKFVGTLKHHRNILCYMKNKFIEIHNKDENLFENLSFSTMTNIGHIMSCFYQLYNHREFRQSIQYTIQWHGYIMNMNIINDKLKNKEISFCKFHKEKNKDKERHTFLKNFHYPLLDNNNIQKNNINIDKNFLITGTNASGKTTFIKGIAMNILLSQQFGCGYYEDAKIKVYSEILSYINIPDSCQRDSLFQAESRRCKKILDQIENDVSSGKTFLCIFDELYSGTNPDEAIASSISYIDYISKYNHVNILLTTHFINFCSYFENKNKNNNNNNNNNNNKRKINYNTKNKVENYHMKSYKFNYGISTQKGALNILKQLEYPKKIIQQALDIISL